MAAPLSNKSSRWYKKQVLDRSEKELKISLQAQGHVFKSRLASAISAAMRCARVNVTQSDTGNAYTLTSRVSANRETLYGLGFCDLGGGFLKLGHSTWRLMGSEGDVTVERLEEESVEAAKFPKRKAQSLPDAGADIQFTSDDVHNMSNDELVWQAERLGLSVAESVIARPAQYRGELIDWLLGQIPKRKANAATGCKCCFNDEDPRPADADRYESTPYECMNCDRQYCRNGDVSSVYSERGNEYCPECAAANPSLLKDASKVSRMTRDLSHLEYPLAVQARMTLNEKVAARTAGQVYCAPTDILVRGLPARVIGHTDHDFLLEFQDSGITCFQPIARILDRDVNSRLAALQESAQALIASGGLSKTARARIAGEVEGDEILTKDDVAGFIAAMDEAVAQTLTARLSRTGQSVQTWTDFNGASVNDFGPTLHGMVAGDATKAFDWQLYSAGKAHDAGQAATLEEAQEDCATAASMLQPKQAQVYDPHWSEAPKSPYDNISDERWLEAWAEASEKLGREPSEEEILHKYEAQEESRAAGLE